MVVDRLVGAQPPEILGAAVPDLHPLLRVDHRDAEPQRRQDRLEELIDLVELARALAQLVVDRLELLVGRLELLVHRLELLVGRLELLVGRLQLLVGRLELLVGRLELVDRGLQLLVGQLEVAPVALQLALQRRIARDVLERHARADRGVVGAQQRYDVDVQPPRIAALGRERRLTDGHAPPLAHRPLERRQQLDRVVGQRELGEGLEQVVARDLKQRAGGQVGEAQPARARDDQVRVRAHLERGVAAHAVVVADRRR